MITETANECQSFVVETLVETLKLMKVCEDVQNCRPAVIKRFILVLNVDVFYTFVNAADKNHPFSRKWEILRKTVESFENKFLYVIYFQPRFDIGTSCHFLIRFNYLFIFPKCNFKFLYLVLKFYLTWIVQKHVINFPIT